MKKNKYKILVLSDLNKSTSTMLKNSVSLAKMIHGEIHFLCVKKPSEIVEKESQLSAMRTINEEHFALKKEILNLTTPISKTHNIGISPTLSFGNVKSEIESCIKALNPDIIVLGKRKPKTIKLMGDNIIQLVLKQHKGVIMISPDEQVIEPNKKLTLGLLNNSDGNFNFEFEKDLMNHINKPFKSFKVIKNSNELKHSSNELGKDVVEFVFEHNDNTIKNLSNYMFKNNINLLCLDRTEGNTTSKSRQTISNIDDIISNLNIPLLLSGVKQLSRNPI